MKKNSIKYFVSLVFLFVEILAYSQETLVLDGTTTGSTLTTCSAIIYDSGGPTGNYQNSENYSVVVCGQNGAPIIVDVTMATESSSFDYLTIYDGATTGSPVLANRIGGNLAETTYEASGNCVTISWHSDVSVCSYAGFTINVRCGFPCQDYTATITPDAIHNNEDDIYYGCSGGHVVADLSFPNNNVNYEQTIENTNFIWNATSDHGVETFEGMGMNTFSDNLAPGAYFLTLTTTDANRCQFVTNTVTIYISVPPTFVGTNVTPEICPGDVANLVGVVNEPPEWVMSIQEVNDDVHCFDDNHIDEEQLSCFTYAAFPGQFITAAADIVSIGMNMEHSYTGDLDIYIQCPNGQRMVLFEQACGGMYFGEAIDFDDTGRDCSTPEYQGVGYDYFWTNTANETMEEACSGSGTSLPEGNYLPVGNFQDLVGCPINGEWCVVFVDNLNADDGTVFYTELHFADYIIPAEENIISFQNTYDVSQTSDDLWWEGTSVAEGVTATSTANPNTPGQINYTFYATDNFGCTYDTTLTVTVRDFTNPLCCVTPTPEITPNTLVCSNRFNLTANMANGNTGVWTTVSSPEGGTATFLNAASPNTQVTIDVWGEYIFRWTENYFGRDDCQGFSETTLNFQEQPTNTFDYTPRPILCNVDEISVSYTGNMTADMNANYTWNFDGAFVQFGANMGGPHIVSWQNAGAHSISLMVENNGCFSDTEIVTIINPERLVVDSIQVVNDPCFQSFGGSATAFHSGGTAPFTYSWEAPGSELQNVGAGNYSLTVTDANGCTAARPYILTEPTQVIIQTTEVINLSCNLSNDGEIAVYAGGGTGDLSYIWSDVGVADSHRTALAAGEYFLTVSDQNNCQALMNFTVTQPEELATILTPSNAICEGVMSNIQLTAMGGTIPYSYIWDEGDGEFEATNQISVLLDTTTHFAVYVRDANGCLSGTETMTVTVSPELIIHNIYLDHVKCNGSCDGRAELNLEGGLLPLQYSWGSDNYIYDGICSGAYTITVTDLIGCSVASSFVITQPEAYVVSSSVDSVSCNGYSDGEARIFVDGATPPYTYLWPNGNTTDILTTSSGTYIVTVHDNNGCSLTREFYIPEPMPIIALPISNQTICKGQQAFLTTQVTGGTPFYDYSWSTPDTIAYHYTVFVVSPTETTNYTLTVTDSNGCSIAPLTTTVNVNPDLAITSIVTSYDTICQGDEALIYVDAIGGNGGPYSLMLQDGRVVPSPFTVRPDSTMMYYITLSDMCGTPSVVDSIQIYVHSYPEELFVAGRVEGCAPLTVEFTPTQFVEGNRYLWTFGDNDFSEEEAPIHTYNKSGDFDVSMKVWSEYGCTITKTLADMIHVYSNPKALFEADLDAVSVLSAEVDFINYSTNANRYFWFFGDQDSSTIENPRHLYNEMGEYEVVLVAENDNKCTDTVSRSITVYNQFSFYAPTSFTPNGDGLNDCFRVCGNGISKNNFLLTVYDRWGELVYKTTKYNSEADCDACSDGAWDGTDWGNKSKGDKVIENGLFYWYCQFDDIFGILHKEQGTVMMVR